MMQMSIRKVMVAAVLSLPLVSLNVQSALADRRDFMVRNNTSTDLKELYVSSSGTDDWEEDVLDVDILPKGESVKVYFNDKSSDCIYDIKGVFADGETVEDRQVNLCKIGTYTFNEQ